MPQADFFLAEAEELLPYLSQVRRHLHAHPEWGADQPDSVCYLAAQFEGMDVQLRHGEGQVGLVVDIDGAFPGPRRALRADMDALHLTESDAREHLPRRLGFCSTRGGIMHACGHDAHCAMLAGAGRAIYRNRATLKGSVRLLFQPGEEGFGGARRMIEAGYLEGVDEVYALHCLPTLKTGQVGYRKGAFCAAIDTFRVKISGVGGHGSAPEKASDQVLALCKVVCDLQHIVSRRIGALEQAVVSVCHLHAGEARAKAVMPEVAEFAGTVRTFAPDTQRAVQRIFHEICEASIKTVNPACTVEIEYLPECPAVVNHDSIVERITPALSGFIEAGDLHTDHRPMLCSEDFSYMLRERPGAFLFVGVTDPTRDPLAAPYLHHPRFDIDERALAVGMRVLCNIAFRADV